MTAIIIVYLIVLAATIYLGYRLNVLKWKKRADKRTVEQIGKGLLNLSFDLARMLYPGRLCNDGRYRYFTKEHDDMIERNTLKYRLMKFGEITDNHDRK